MHGDVRGFRYWCGVYLYNHFQVFRIYTVPTAGAQFLFTSSATRGSIALMSWAFIFFLAGFLIPTLAQVLFSWTATMSPGIRFRYPQRIFNKLGEFLGIAILGGVLSTVAAIFLILLSLYGIRYSPIISGAAPGTFFTNSVWVACLVALSITSFYALLFILYVVLFLCNIRYSKTLRAMFLGGA